MASIKIKFRPSSTANKEGVIYYQIIHNRISRQLRTDYKIFANEWDSQNASIIFASIAKSQNVPIAIISEGMGHTSEATTRIYLASLDNSKLDKANAKILKGLQGVQTP